LKIKDNFSVVLFQRIRRLLSVHNEKLSRRASGFDENRRTFPRSAWVAGWAIFFVRYQWL